MTKQATTPEPPAGVDFTKYKIQPRYVPSDDCVVSVDGVDHRPHAGEGVWLFPASELGQYLAFQALAGTAELEDSEGKLQAQVAAYQGINEAIAQVIAAWTWTDWAGRPLPQPDGDYRAIQRLHAQEIAWLRSAIEGETPAQVKNDDDASADGSTAEALPLAK